MTPLLLRLAVRLLPADARAEVLRELLEQQRNVRRDRGRIAAWWWVCRQPLAALAMAESRSGGLMLRGVLDDLRVSPRSLARRPALAVTVIATVAISVGAIAAIASVIDAVLLRPLPFPDADQLVWVSSYERAAGAEALDPNDATRAYANPMDVVDWAARERHLVALAPYETREATIGAGDRPLRVNAAVVRATMAEVLAIPAAYGRLFTDADDAAGTHVVVLSHALWRNAFGADPGRVGRTVFVDGVGHEVVGVLPELGMKVPGPGIDMWLPLPPPAADFQNRGGVWQRVLARIDSGVTLEAAQADMDRIARELEQEYPDSNHDRHIALVPLRQGLVGSTRSVLRLMAGAVVLVLLVACANVGHLMLVSAHSRQRELAVRAALGAGVSRLARLLLLESAWLAMVGGALGLVLGSSFLRVFLALYPEDLPAVGNITLGAWPFAVGLASIGVASLLAVVPSLLRARGLRLQQAMRTSERGPENRQQRRVRAGLVVTQVAMSTMLLIGGGLLLRTFLTMRATEPGFAGGPVLTFNLALGERQYPELADEVRFYDQLLAGIRALPGVKAAGTTTLLPLTSGEFGDGFYRVGYDDVYPNIPIARLQNVTPGYFEAIGLPVKTGRSLQATDTASAPRVVVVNEALERDYFPQGAMGQRMRFRGQIAGIVGIVGDKHHRSLRDTPRPEMFYPRAQVIHPRLFSWVVVRVSGDAMALLPAIRTVVAGLDDGVAIDDPQLMDDRVDRAVAPDRFRASLVGTLAVVALLLAAIGLYGLIAYAVARDARDIAIRMALGASAGKMAGRVLGSVLLLAGTGVALGLIAAVAGQQWLASFLTGVTARDPLTIGATAFGLLAVALLAAAAPAARASRIDPADVLRNQ